jgi:hypothetical protein
VLLCITGTSYSKSLAVPYLCLRATTSTTGSTTGSTSTTLFLSRQILRYSHRVGSIIGSEQARVSSYTRAAGRSGGCMSCLSRCDKETLSSADREPEPTCTMQGQAIFMPHITQQGLLRGAIGTRYTEYHAVITVHHPSPTAATQQGVNGSTIWRDEGEDLLR